MRVLAQIFKSQVQDKTGIVKISKLWDDNENKIIKRAE